MSSRRIRSALNSLISNPSKGRGTVRKTRRTRRQQPGPQVNPNNRLGLRMRRGRLVDLSQSYNRKVCRSSKADNSSARRNRHAHGSSRKDG
jgi:hypothetical protein